MPCCHENRLVVDRQQSASKSQEAQKLNRIDRSTIRIHNRRITLHELKHAVRCQPLHDVSIHYSCSLVFHAIQGVYEETSWKYKYMCLVEGFNPCRSIRKKLAKELVRV